MNLLLMIEDGCSALHDILWQSLSCASNMSCSASQVLDTAVRFRADSRDPREPR